MDMHTALILRRMVIVLTAEELMKKKGIFKQELDAQTTKSNELWQKSTEKLSEIMKHYAWAFRSFGGKGSGISFGMAFPD